MKLAFPLAILLFVVLGCGPGPGSYTSNNSTNNAGQPANNAEKFSQAKTLVEGKSVHTADLDKAEKILRTIDKSAPEFKDATELLNKIKQLRPDVAKREQQDREHERNGAIMKLEDEFLKKGMDVHFDWPKKDTLRMKYVLMSRPMVYKIQNETDFMANLARLGVKRVIFTDGFNETWTFDL